MHYERLNFPMKLRKGDSMTWGSRAYTFVAKKDMTITKEPYIDDTNFAQHVTEDLEKKQGVRSKDMRLLLKRKTP